MNNKTEFVKHLIIITVLVFLGANFVGSADHNYNLFALHSFDSPDFHWYQFISHIFMHAQMPQLMNAKLPSLMHIAFNMFALYQFGSVLERFWGGKRFLFFYIACGLGAALIYNLVNYYHFHDVLSTLMSNGFRENEIIETINQGKYDTRWLTFINQSSLYSFTSGYFSSAVGASGAIYGLLVTYGFMFPEAELGFMFIPVPVKAKYFIPGLIAVDLFFGLKGQSLFGYGGTGIGHFAHIGGAIFGFLIMWTWRNNKFKHTRLN